MLIKETDFLFVKNQLQLGISYQMHYDGGSFFNESWKKAKAKMNNQQCIKTTKFFGTTGMEQYDYTNRHQIINQRHSKKKFAIDDQPTNQPTV